MPARTNLERVQRPAAPAHRLAAGRHPGRRVHHKAPSGGQVAGRSPVDRGKQGRKRSVAADAAGIPLGLVAAGANRNHSPLLAPTSQATISQVGPMPEQVRAHLDRGYDNDPSRAALVEFGFDGEAGVERSAWFLLPGEQRQSRLEVNRSVGDDPDRPPPSPPRQEPADHATGNRRITTRKHAAPAIAATGLLGRRHRRGQRMTQQMDAPRFRRHARRPQTPGWACSGRTGDDEPEI
jgi:hypothetical protein